MANIHIKRATLILIALVTGQPRYSLGNQNLLRGKRVKHVFALNSSTTPEGPSGETVAGNGFFLTLRNNANEAVLDSTASALLSGEGENLIEINSQEITWEKSEIYVTGVINTGDVVALQVLFE